MDNRFREAVYLATVPESFSPDRCWTLPESATDLKLYAKKLSYEQAAGFVSTHNGERIEARKLTGEPIGTWAIFAKWVKPRILRYELRKRLASHPKRMIPAPHRIRSWGLVDRAAILEAVTALKPADICGIPQSDWWNAFIRLAWDTGLRVSDILSLEPADITADGALLAARDDTDPIRCELQAETFEALRKIIDPARRKLFPWDRTREELAKATRWLAHCAAKGWPITETTQGGI